MADNSLPDDDELITRRAVRSLRRAAPIAIVAALVAFAAAFVLAGESDPAFQSTGAVELTDDTSAGITSSVDRTNALQEIEGRIGRIESAEFLAVVRGEMGELGAELNGIDASPTDDTPVITIVASASTAAAAQTGADTAISTFIAERDGALRASVEAELGPLRTQRADQLQVIDGLALELAEARAANALQDDISILERRTDSALDRLAEYDRAIQEREFLAESANGQVVVVSQASAPEEVTTSQFARPIQLALLVLVLALLGAVLYNRLRGRLNLLDEIRTIAGPDVPILATVPRFRSKFRKGNDALVVGRRNARREAEAFRYLRTSIEVATEQHIPIVVAFTSANPNEGKSVTAGNYALAVARAGRSVGVLDGDLLNSSVASLFGVDGDNGFSAIMTGEAKAEDGGWASIATSDRPVDIFVRARGTLPSSRQELPTDAVEDTYDQLVQYYDIIVVDCPPVLAVSDSVVLTRSADVAVMVVRMGRTTRRDLEKSLRQLEQSKVKLAGIVITHSTDRSESYYGYGYGYGGSYVGAD